MAKEKHPPPSSSYSSSSAYDDPLLSCHLNDNSNNIPYSSKIKNLVLWILKTLMLAVLAAWIVMILLVCITVDIYIWMEGLEDEPIFSIAGGTTLVFTAPILVLTCLAAAYLIIRGHSDHHRISEDEEASSEKPRVRLWAFPVLVDGPFSVVSAAELIGICLVVAYVIWAMSSYTQRNLKTVADLPVNERGVMLLEYTGKSFAAVGLYCLGFLFIPVTRGSFLLRVIDIPFDHACKYHIWLGNLTLLMFTLHGLFYIIGYAIQGELLQALTSWSDSDVANFPGVINYCVTLLIWITSTYPVRKKQFELFFYTHQLYIVFLILLAMHAGGESFAAIAGGVFLFMLDRVLRFCQSRKRVDVISAKRFPCGIVQLVLAKPVDLQYNALSFVFIKIKELSWLQWHPFSVSSSPLDGKNHLSVLIKDSGNWTAKLNKNVLDACQNGLHHELPLQAYPQLTASVEGPYGHEHPYHLTYKNLILVAGGIGISPFFAILSDIFHRKSEGKFCLPENILLIWAIKKHDELSLFYTLNMESFSPSLLGKLNIEVQIHVTREVEPPLEEGKAYSPAKSINYDVSIRNGISGLVGTGNLIWSSLHVLFSVVGFVVLLVFVQVLIVAPPSIEAWWCKGLLFIACTVAAAVTFGGIVIYFWHVWEERKLGLKGEEEEEQSMKNIEELQQSMVVSERVSFLRIFYDSTSIFYGSRPDFREIFGSISERWGFVDVGVIVCGPPTLEKSVARECRSRNMNRESHDPIFHFNNHSFDL